MDSGCARQIHILKFEQALQNNSNIGFCKAHIVPNEERNLY